MARKYRRVQRKKSTKRNPSSWKRLKKQFKFKKRLQQVKIALTIIIGVILVGGTLYLWNFFARPFASAGSTFQGNVSWDSQTPLNLMFLEVADVDEPSSPTKKLGVLAFNPTQESFAVVNIPVEYDKFGDLYGLGNLSGKNDGLKVVGNNLKKVLGVPIDGYILVGEDGIKQIGELFSHPESLGDVLKFGNLLQFPKVWSIARENLRTNLDIKEIAQVLWYLMQVRSDKVVHLNLSVKLLDDSNTLDKKLSPFFRDEKLATEHLKIQVLNGSNLPGLAGDSTRIIKNIGGEVIRVDNFERQDLIKGYLVLESSGSYTARRLAHIFSVSDSRPPKTGAEARANVTLILGKENAF
jgi:hypothetical protein